MKLTVLSTAIALAIVAVSPARADLYVGQADWAQVNYQGQGGEFRITANSAQGSPLEINGAGAQVPLTYYPLSGGPTTAYVAGITKSTNDTWFQTFCIETGEYITEPMDVVLSTTWADGTNSPDWSSSDKYPQSHAIMGRMPPNGDDLSPETAYLYTKFAEGTLNGYNYGVDLGNSPNAYGLTRAQSAGALQRVIWVLENEGGDDFGSTYYSIALTTQQQSAANAWLSDAKSNAPDTIGRVRVLNTWVVGKVNSTDPNDRKQDLLWIAPPGFSVAPVPSAFLLGGIGLGIVALMRKRRRA